MRPLEVETLRNKTYIAIGMNLPKTHFVSCLPTDFNGLKEQEENTTWN